MPMQMKPYIQLSAALLLLAACANDNDDYTVALYSDAALTSFAITGGRVAKTDTTWRTLGSTELAACKFRIDQKACEVYNPDSLPYRTDATKLLCAAGTKNNGAVGIEAGENTIALQTTDSIDFSGERHLRVYASDGSQMRRYTVRVNVRQQPESAATELEEAAESTIPQDVRDGVDSSNIARLLGMSTAEMHAIAVGGGFAVSRDGGRTWQPDNMLDSPDMMPTEGLAYNAAPFAYQDSTDYVVAAGTRPDTDYTIVWRKIADYSQSAKPGQWSLMSDADSRKLLPRLQGLRLLGAKGKLFAKGKLPADGNADGQEVTYQSRDGGITWKKL